MSAAARACEYMEVWYEAYIYWGGSRGDGKLSLS